MKRPALALLLLALPAAPLATEAQTFALPFLAEAQPAEKVTPVGSMEVGRSGDSERLAAAVAVDLTARYVGFLSGSADGSGFEALIIVDLVQAGNRVFEVRSTRPCASVLRGSGVIEDGGAVMRGSYGGAGCPGWITATFRVNRELYVHTFPKVSRPGKHVPEESPKEPVYSRDLRACRHC
jgi:hypothetical protein